MYCFFLSTQEFFACVNSEQGDKVDPLSCRPSSGLQGCEGGGLWVCCFFLCTLEFFA